MKIIMSRFADGRLGDDARTIDMAPDGTFREPPRAPLADRVMGYAALTFVAAAGLAAAALAFWFAMILIPVALAAGAIAYLVFRYRLWRAGVSLGGNGDVLRR